MIASYLAILPGIYVRGRCDSCVARLDVDERSGFFVRVEKGSNASTPIFGVLS